MQGKSKSWILIGVLLAALTATGMSQVPTTQVADTIYHADGTTATGTAIISWPAFTTASGEAIPSGSTSSVIAAGGALSVQLISNAGATPIGSYYTVVYHLDDGSENRQYWVVPMSSSAVKVSAIENSVLPISVAMQTVSKSYVDTAIATALAGQSPDMTSYVQKAGDTMTGPLLLPADPVSSAQAADKHYVDASVAAAGGTSAPATQYAIPAYLLSPSGGLASAGPTHLAIDPTGYNLSGYHVAFTDLGINSSSADCTQVGSLFGGHSCVSLNFTYPTGTKTDSIHWGQVLNFTAYGAGSNLGNDGSPQRQDNPFGINANNLARGGNAASILSLFNSRVGDTGPWYVYDFAAGGTQAPSDEGTTVMGTFEGGESYGYTQSTVTAGGSHATNLTLVASESGCGSFNLCYPVDGGILLDTQTVAASGYLNSASAQWSEPSNVPLHTIAVTGVTLPTTTAWGYANGVSITPDTMRNNQVAETVAITMVTGTFSPGDFVCVGGTATTSGFSEQSTITSVSGGNITLPLAYPYTNIVLFKGGPCGTYMSLNADIALSGYSPIIQVFGSLTGSDAIVAVPSSSGLNQALTGGTIPQAGVEPETHGGSSDASAAFTTYCGAEVVANLSSTTFNPQIDPNNCAWAPGDTVESPHFPTQKVYGATMIVNQNMPNNGGGTGGISIDLGGMGVAAFTQGYAINNTTPASWYTVGGGKLTPPGCAFCATGTWNDGLSLGVISNYAVEVGAHYSGQTSVGVFKDTAWGQLNLTSAGFNTNNTPLNLGNGGIYAAQGEFTASLDTKTTGSTAEISVINGSLRNTAATFTQAGENGARADFGEVPGGAITPFQPLLTVLTDDAFRGIDGDVLYTYNSSYTAVPFLFVGAGQGAATNDTNLSLENGATHCSLLICLGPDATVDASGNLTVASCTGCGSGSTFITSLTTTGTSGAATVAGGVLNVPQYSGISGLTAGYIPLAGSATTITANSHCDDGVTAGGTVTCTEPIATNGGASGVSISTTVSGGDAGFTVTPNGADQWDFVATGSGGPPNTISFYDVTANYTPLAIFSHAGVSSVGTYSGGVFGWNSDARYASGTLDTGLSRDAAGVVDVGNGTQGDTSGTINAALYNGPATAPSGSCSAIGWVFSQDGHATFCTGSTWVTKI